MVEHHSRSELRVLVPITLESCILSRRIGVGSSVEELLSSPSKVFSNQESLWFAKKSVEGLEIADKNLPRVKSTEV